MGDFVYVDTVGRECMCLCCSKVYRNPVTFKKCRHSFCRTCSIGIVGYERRCMICAQPVSMEDIVPCKYSELFAALWNEIAGATDLRYTLDRLKVACRKRGCVWQGALGSYGSHTCPTEVDCIADISRLQEIINFDGRMYIKLEAFRKIGREILNDGGQVKNLECLGMIAAYMKRYIGFVEVCTVCLGVLENVVKTESGKAAMLGCGSELDDVLKDVTAYEELRARALTLRDELSNSEGNSLVSVLVRIQSRGRNTTT